MSEFDSLFQALAAWFHAGSGDLPDALRQRVDRACFPMSWDSLSTDQRRSVAAQFDDQRDPATEGARQAGWDFALGRQTLETEIAKWEAVSAPAASDLAVKQARLKDLRRDLARLKQSQRDAEGDATLALTQPGDQLKANPPTDVETSPGKYIPYPKALRLLAERLSATPEEVAAWVWAGPDDGGLSAWLQANRSDRPRRFFFDLGDGDNFDYVAPLMACWFLESDIADFEPDDRYITGKVLIDRWREHPGIRLDAFIQAKIAESRLHDYHPIYGWTQGSFPGDLSCPPRAIALFLVSEVMTIEAEDFGMDDLPVRAGPTPKGNSKATTEAWMRRVRAEATMRWNFQRQHGANPTKRSLSEDLATWCHKHGLKTKTDINPSAYYIYRHVLNGWKPPDD